MNYAPKKYDELTFVDDFMFCKILQNNEGLCQELLELILGKKIHLVGAPEKQKTIEITSDGKGIRLDIYVEDEKQTVYDVEMQTTKRKNLPKRSRYYQAMIDLSQIERGADYSELKKSYVIFICPFDYFNKKRHKYTFGNQCEEVPELFLGDETWKIFLCACDGEDDVSQEVKEFLNYLTKHEIKGKLAEKIEDQVCKARAHDEWRTEYMSLYLRDLENRKLGREEGREEGRQEGRDEMLFALVQKNMISLEDAVRESGLQEEEFLAKMKEVGFVIPK